MLKSITGPLFYLLMGLGVVICMSKVNVLTDAETRKIFPFFYALVVIYVLYQILFGYELSNAKSWTYFVAKIVCTLALIVSFSEFPEFNSKSLLKICASVITGLTIIGHFIFNISANGRQALGFVNPNSMGALAAISLGILVFMPWQLSRKWINYALYGALIIAIMQSGSRNAMIMVIIMLLFKYGLKLGLVFKGLMVVAIVIFMLPKMGIQLTSFDRLTETVQSGNMAEGRENERKAAMVMIKEHPIEGNGLYATQSEESLKISQYGSHNGYLDFCKMLGIPLALILFLFLAIDYFNLLRYSIKTNFNSEKCCMFISTSVLMASMNEAYLWGVNQPVTTFFFVSFGLWAVMARTDYLSVDENQCVE